MVTAAMIIMIVVVILVIDLFFNSAMYLAAGREFKYLCMALSVCALVCAVMQRRETK